MAIKRVTVFKTEIEDVPGSLLGLLPGVADVGVNLLNLAAFSAGGGKGAAYFLADKPEDVKKFADSQGIGIDEYAAFLLSGEAAVGTGAEIVSGIADAGINMVLATATVVEGQYYLLIAVSESDADATASALGS